MVNQLHIIRALLIASFLFSFTICHTQTSTINWVAIPDGGNGTCGPTSSYPDAQVCYGIEYTPTNTGVLTSYTMGFLVECPENFSPSINSMSCLMTDNSNVIDGCAQANLQLFVASANNGNLAITAGVPVIIHEVCMNFHFLDSIDIEIETITGISFSVNLANGDPVTESAPFDDFIADYSIFGLGSCEDTTLCSVYFSTEADKINLDENALGNIIHADPNNDLDQHTQSFDIYDEDNLFCTVPGGKDDVTIDMKMIHTYDINGNGIIDKFVGSSMKLIQDNNGLSGIIPFGNTLEDESSSGDVRGYEINVDFADHISIRAGQLNVLIKDVDHSKPLFESASLEFYGPENFLYGKIDHHGFYNGPTDLTGNCQITAPAGPQQIAGNGVSNIDNKQTIDLSSPCIPSSTGSTNNDTLSINASLEGGLHPDDLITGFRLTVLGEDIAAPNLLDDGSNSGPEDGVVANRNTSTQTTLLSSLLGYQIDGCVFANEARPPISLDVTASHNYLSIGDSIRYNVAVINNDVATLNPVDVKVDLSSELINVISEAPGVLNGQEVDFDNLDIIRLDTVNYFVRGAVSPSSPTSDEILDIVEGSSDFEDASYHHDFTPWVISNINPRSGSEHWYASTDSAFVIKYLNLSEIIIPTEESILSFWHDYDTEIHQDGGQVEISVDNGNTWVSLADHFTSNGYNDYING